MSVFLPDVNVLLALVTEGHVSHEKVKRWFQKSGSRQWATCPLTEAGFVRIASNPKFSEDPLDIGEALEMLKLLTKNEGHDFWPVDIAFSEAVQPVSPRLFGHRQVMDAYLLGLAIHKNGTLVTLDGALRTLAGREFGNHLLCLE